MSEEYTEPVDVPIVDEAVLDNQTSTLRYDITSFGADYDVDGLVKRIGRGDIFIPSFQRDYVWNIKDASRFIESLLLGLPVPGIFLAKENETNRLLVIDGQQRLKSLQFFFDGYFNPKEGDKSKRVFRLSDVQPKFNNKAFRELDPSDQLQLTDSIIHATIIKQDSPANDDTSIYHVFERLNTGGRKLFPQEIRVAIYHGSLMKALEQANECPDWREMYGPLSPRLKDQELILRFIALYISSSKYSKPLAEFLNKFASENKNASPQDLERWVAIFSSAMRALKASVGKDAFRKGKAINTAMFDSVAVGVARRIERGPISDMAGLVSAHQLLMKDADYQSAIEKATSDETNVAVRIRRATEYFSAVK